MWWWLLLIRCSVGLRKVFGQILGLSRQYKGKKRWLLSHVVIWYLVLKCILRCSKCIRHTILIFKFYIKENWIDDCFNSTKLSSWIFHCFPISCYEYIMIFFLLLISHSLLPPLFYRLKFENCRNMLSSILWLTACLSNTLIIAIIGWSQYHHLFILSEISHCGPWRRILILSQPSRETEDG